MRNRIERRKFTTYMNISIDHWGRRKCIRSPIITILKLSRIMSKGSTKTGSIWIEGIYNTRISVNSR
jgi:hypothetical protein